MRRMKDVKIFNPISAMGFLDGKISVDSLTAMWGPDPVHPSQEAYHLLAAKVVETCDDLTTGNTSTSGSQPSGFKRPAERSEWIARSEPVAKRLIPSPGPSGPYRGRGSMTSSGQRGYGAQRPSKGRPPFAHHPSYSGDASGSGSGYSSYGSSRGNTNWKKRGGGGGGYRRGDGAPRRRY